MRKLNIVASFSLCTLASFSVLHKLGYPLIGIDDANIYFVYARNLANGYGFVYNVGGERVEGFTSLLWTLISALAFKFSAYPELTLLIINIILLSLGIAYALSYIQDIFSQINNRKAGIFWSAVFLVLMVSSPRYIVWNTITLMENALWSTLLLLTTIFVIRDHKSAKEANLGFIPLSILLLITRPESIVWVAVFAAILTLRLAVASNFMNAVKSFAPAILCIVLSFALLIIFRLWYFGYPFPNTYYAKVSPSFSYNLLQGSVYLLRYFTSDSITVISVISVFLACVCSLLRPNLANGAFFLPFIAATGLLVPLLTGGDHFGSFRFYQNVYPLTVLGAIYFSREILPKITGSFRYSYMSPRSRILLFSGVGLLLIYAFVTTQVNAWSHFSAEIDVEFKIAAYERENGRFVQRLFASQPVLPSIGVIASGGIKYSYEGEIIDLLGLNNVMMAHNYGNRVGYKNHAAFEVSTFYKLQPDIVWPVIVDESKWQYSEIELREKWANIFGFKGLFGDLHFLDLYKYAKVTKKSGAENSTALVAWFRKEFLKGLTAKEEFLVEEYEYSP